MTERWASLCLRLKSHGRIRALIVATLVLPFGARGAAAMTSAPGPTATAARPATVASTATPTTGPPATATPTPVPSPTPQLPSLPPVYYWDGATVYAVNPDGSFPAIVVTLPASSTVQPALLPDGRLLFPTGGGFAVIDRYGRRYGLRTPDLNAGETVWSVQPSPDGGTLAWQLFAPLQLNGYTVNTGLARIVLTGRFGGAGSAVLSAQASGSDGQVPVLMGWRPASPYSLNGGPTLLLQDLYNNNDVQAGVLFNAARGLLEYDPAVDDLVNDYLPPLTSEIPRQRAFTVSADGIWSVYGDFNAFTPSGEGPLAQAIDALNLNTNAVVPLDAARHYPDKEQVVTTQKHKVGKRTVTRKVTTTLRLYQYFSHHAYVAPGDGRVLYTLLTVSYPSGALTPHVRASTLVATLDGRPPVMLAQDAQGEGWLSAGVAVVKRADGLYAVDVVSGGLTRLATGRAVQFIGMRD